MKKAIRFCLALAALACIASCQPVQTYETPDSVYVGTQAVSGGVSAAAGEQHITIFATCDWRSTCDSDWITVSPKKGEVGIHEITLTYTENATGEVRSGSVTFYAGKISDTFTLVQKK